jgi:hypothetical protein
MTRNHAPSGPLLPPNICVPPLYNFACTRCVPYRLNGFSTHHYGYIIVEPDRLYPSLESSVSDQTSLDQRQGIITARRYLILRIIHGHADR